MGNIFSDPSSNITDAEVAAIGMMTGVISGGEVTISATGPANTLVNVAAGTGIIIDWTATPVATYTPVEWDAFEDVVLTGLLTSTFTSLYIDVASALQQVEGALITEAQKRVRIVLEAPVHGGTTISNISANSIQAYQGLNAIIDYITKLGPINVDNRVSAAASDLTIQKAAGTTSLPWINRGVDPQSPTTKINAAEPSMSFTESYADGIGGFTFVQSQTNIDPDQFDDGSGTLAAVSNNKWTIQRCYFFGQPTTGSLAVTYGTVEYSSLAIAEAAIISENPDVSPLFSTGSFVTALIVKKGATDLSDIAVAKFVDISGLTSSASGGSGSQDVQSTYDLSGLLQILTNSTQGAFSVQIGTGVDTDNVWEGRKQAGNITSSIDGDGNLFANGEAQVATTRILGPSLEINELGTGDRLACARYYSAGTAQAHNAEVTRNAGVNATFNILSAGTSQIQVQQGGTGGVALLNGATAWASISDVNKKKNIVALSGSLAKLLTLDPCFFDYKNDSYPKKRVGLTAQEVQKVLPEAVHTVEERDSEGKVTGETSLVVTYTDLIPLLISGIQELTARVEDLEGA